MSPAIKIQFIQQTLRPTVAPLLVALNQLVVPVDWRDAVHASIKIRLYCQKPEKPENIQP